MTAVEEFWITIPVSLSGYEKYKSSSLSNNIFVYDANRVDPTPCCDLLDEKVVEGEILGFEEMDIFEEYTEETYCKKKYDLHLNDNNLNIKIYDFEIFHDNPALLSFQTNKVCWWCCHHFNNDPVFVPKKFEDGVFQVFGNFCSYNCALSYNYNDSKTNLLEISEREGLIYLFLKKNNNIIFNKSIEIKYAPPREVLNIFGGILSIDDFRKCDRHYKINYPPMITIIPELEEMEFNKKITDDINTAREIRSDFKTPVVKKNKFLLKRSKKVKKNTLDKYF